MLERQKARQAWSNLEERELARRYDLGYGPLELSQIMGRSVASINAKLDYMLVTRKNTYRAWTVQEIRKARIMREQGMTLKAIGEVLNRSGTSVRNALLRNVL